MLATPRFSKTDLVTKRDGDGTVGFILSADPRIHAGEYWYRVQFGGATENCRESDLNRHVESDDLAQLLSSDAYGGPDAFRRHVTTVKLQLRLTDTLYSYGASKTKLYPYQFVPLLKFLNSPYKRLLIADEVGLGKTIEAGYILQEELARGTAPRVLIVCPASLRRKWQDEMLDRFGHRFDILSASEARRRVPLSDQERRSGRPLRAITSVQSIRNPQFIETIHTSAAPIDLLIVDEAHHCRNPDTFQYKAVSALVEQADSVIFLSATPIQTSATNLFTLLNLLVPEEFPAESAFQQRLRANGPIVQAETLIRRDGTSCLKEAASALRSIESGAAAFATSPLYQEIITDLESNRPDSPARRVELQERLNQINLLSNIFTRTKRKDVHLNTAQRQALVPAAHLTDYEQEVYDAISNFIFGEYQTRHGDAAARLVLVTYQRQIASSLPAAVRKFRDAARAAAAAWDPELESPNDEQEVDLDEAPAYQPAGDPRFQQLILDVDVEQLERQDTKLRLLIDAIKEQHRLVSKGQRRSRKMIVFSYFRRSLDYLERQLDRSGITFVRIDGSVPSTPGDPDTDERGKRIDQFRFDAKIDVLLTSEVSSEGIDLQFADTVVNWDLPWNPMVVEQRIGRVDRIGQVSPRIFIINIASAGTIEATILERLYQRIGIFEHSIGELEPILGDMVRELEEELFRPNLSNEQKKQVLHARGLAIETHRRQQETLEQQAASLIGHDEFFRTKLDNIRRFGRYVGGEELRLFVENEIQHAVPGLSLAPAKQPGVFHLPYRPELEQFVLQSLPAGDEEGLRFLQRSRRGENRLVFEGELAEELPHVEPVHAQHPLVRALTAGLTSDAQHHPQVARIRLRSNLVEPGPWFFAWALISETGFLSARSLMCAVMNLSDSDMPVISDDAGDQLLAEMLRTGQAWSDFNPPSLSDAQFCLDTAEDRLRERVRDLDSRRRSRLDSIKAARRATVAATFDLRIERQRERTQEMEQRAASEESGAARILPAYRARLSQLETERVVQLEMIDQLKEGTVSYALLGAGFVDVVSHQGER